mmetsp:Transcript_4501/g.11129  ORF Transcript_4501/g.11129 Transcript_4501/m.11129 type:complete len:103 (+) Transcript_4501:33-341(+)
MFADIAHFQSLAPEQAQPYVIHPTRTPNWAPWEKTVSAGYNRAALEAWSCVGGDVSCSLGKMNVNNPSNYWSGPNDDGFPHYNGPPGLSPMIHNDTDSPLSH